MNYLDSNILACAFYDNQETKRCQKAIAEGGVTNTFNIIEAFHIIEKELNREEAKQCMRELLKGNLQIEAVDANLLFEALKRMKTHHLSIFDAIHYTCALLNHCSAIFTYDKDFNGLDIPRKEP